VLAGRVLAGLVLAGLVLTQLEDCMRSDLQDDVVAEVQEDVVAEPEELAELEQVGELEQVAELEEVAEEEDMVAELEEDVPGTAEETGRRRYWFEPAADLALRPLQRLAQGPEERSSCWRCCYIESILATGEELQKRWQSECVRGLGLCSTQESQGLQVTADT
jgi:hypothetical protein